MSTEITPDLLRQIMECGADRAAECFPAMVSAMRQFDISTPARITCFFTQVKWESGGLVYFAELADGTAYNGRADLGNTQPGDGPRFKGSGPIQVTGRSNFAAAQQALDAAGISINILANPDLARTVQYGFWISGWWWAAHGGNTVAERTPLDYASLCCGRLVNRGDADSPYQAQGEDGRVAAFAHVSQFGDLALPGPVVPPVVTPVTPIPNGDDQMALNADVAAAFAAVNKKIDTVAAAVVKAQPAPLFSFFVVKNTVFEANIVERTYRGMSSPSVFAARRAALVAAGVPFSFVNGLHAIADPAQYGSLVK